MGPWKKDQGGRHLGVIDVGTHDLAGLSRSGFIALGLGTNAL